MIRKLLSISFAVVCGVAFSASPALATLYYYNDGDGSLSPEEIAEGCQLDPNIGDYGGIDCGTIDISGFSGWVGGGSQHRFGVWLAFELPNGDWQGYNIYHSWGKAITLGAVSWEYLDSRAFEVGMTNRAEIWDSDTVVILPFIAEYIGVDWYYHGFGADFYTTDPSTGLAYPRGPDEWYEIGLKPDFEMCGTVSEQRLELSDYYSDFGNDGYYFRVNSGWKRSLYPSISPSYELSVLDSDSVVQCVLGIDNSATSWDGVNYGEQLSPLADLVSGDCSGLSAGFYDVMVSVRASDDFAWCDPVAVHTAFPVGLDTAQLLENIEGITAIAGYPNNGVGLSYETANSTVIYSIEGPKFSFKAGISANKGIFNDASIPVTIDLEVYNDASVCTVEEFLLPSNSSVMTDEKGTSIMSGAFTWAAFDVPANCGYPFSSPASLSWRARANIGGLYDTPWTDYNYFSVGTDDIEVFSGTLCDSCSVWDLGACIGCVTGKAFEMLFIPSSKMGENAAIKGIDDFKRANTLLTYFEDTIDRDNLVEDTAIEAQTVNGIEWPSSDFIIENVRSPIDDSSMVENSLVALIWIMIVGIGLTAIFAIW